MAKLNQDSALQYAWEQKYGRDETSMDSFITSDSRYARLLRNSGNPSAWIRKNSVEGEQKLNDRSSNHIHFVPKFLSAQGKWLASRLKEVDKDVYEQRVEICRSCPNLSMSPSTAIYHLGKRILNPTDNSICTVCGCFITVKAKREVENCPVKHANNNNLSKWGEPIVFA